MSIALQKSQARPLRPTLPWVVLGAGVVLTAGNLAWLAFGPRAASATREAEAAAGPSRAPDAVSLPDQKFRASGIALGAAEVIDLPAELGVPGRVEANQDRQVRVRPRASGVVREVKVALGQRVTKGQVLAVLTSGDVGTARLHLRAKQRDLMTARSEADWKRQVAANVADLIPELRKQVDATLLQKRFADRPMGTFRQQLLQAYAEYDIASHEEEKTNGLFQKKIVGEHPAFLAMHTRQGVQSKFEGVLDVARFDAQQQSRVAADQVRLAEAGVIDAAERLQILGVTEDVAALLASPERGAGLVGDDTTVLQVVAPFDATVIEKSPMAVPSQTVEVNEVLFALADLADVWVTADVPESDFALLPALERGAVRLSAKAYPGREFGARVRSVGAAVDPTTRTVPMLAETANADGALKLGMFVRIVLDTAAADRVLTVPASALVEIDGKAGVFLPGPESGSEDKGHEFTFRAVKPGRESGDRRVIAAGLEAGEKIVARGAFVLKSELILQNETGED